MNTKEKINDIFQFKLNHFQGFTFQNKWGFKWQNKNVPEKVGNQKSKNVRRKLHPISRYMKYIGYCFCINELYFQVFSKNIRRWNYA